MVGMELLNSSVKQEAAVGIILNMAYGVLITKVVSDMVFLLQKW